jgi:hypothetical protein
MEREGGILARIKFAFIARRAIDSGAGREPGRTAGEAKSTETVARSLLSIRELGQELPPSTSSPEKKRALVEQVATARMRASVTGDTSIKPARHTRTASHPALAKVALALVVLLAALAVLVGFGAGAVEAMPGNPLYSVKRLVEKAGMAFTPGKKAKANAYLDRADERMKELKYAETHKMTGWYYGLSRDALASLASANRQISSLGTAQQASVAARARSIIGQSQSPIQTALPDMRSIQKKYVVDRAARIQQEYNRYPVPPSQQGLPPTNQQPPPSNQQPAPSNQQQPPPTNQQPAPSNQQQPPPTNQQQPPPTNQQPPPSDQQQPPR